MNKSPDFLIIGAQKAGTTYLYGMLRRHSNFGAPQKKELHYFDTARYGRHTVSEYLGQFPDVPLTGEASPYYMFCPRVARRVYEALPGGRLIILLRDPVTRAFSDYQHKVREGTEIMGFEEAIKAEHERTAGEIERMYADETCYSRPLRRYSYLARSIYADQLATWLRYFPREQLLVLKTEDMQHNSLAVYHETLRFLEEEPHEPEDYPRGNIGGYTENINPKTRARLQEYFRPHNERLYELLGRDFGW